MKENNLIDYINESDLKDIENKIKNLNKYNDISKRKLYYKEDPFSILNNNLIKLQNNVN